MMNVTRVITRSAPVLLILAALLFGSASIAMAGLATSPFTFKTPVPAGLVSSDTGQLDSR